MEVAVDQVADGFFGDFAADLREQRGGGGGLGVRIDHQHIAVQHEDGRVAVGQYLRPGERGVDAFGHLLYGEQVARGGLRLGAGPTGAQEAFFENGGTGENCTEGSGEEITARVVMVMAHAGLL